PLGTPREGRQHAPSNEVRERGRTLDLNFSQEVWVPKVNSARLQEAHGQVGCQPDCRVRSFMDPDTILHGVIVHDDMEVPRAPASEAELANSGLATVREAFTNPLEHRLIQSTRHEASTPNLAPRIRSTADTEYAPPDNERDVGGVIGPATSASAR